MNKILTTAGLKNENEIVQGDMLYEYGTSEPVEIVYVDMHHEQLYGIHYTDGRTDTVGEFELSMLKGISPVLYPIEFKKIHRPLNPDAYIAGIFFMVGKFDDKYVNIPDNSYAVLDTILNTLSVEEDGFAEGKLYFRSIFGGKRLSWLDIFPDHRFYSNEYWDIGAPMVPEAYLNGSIESRKMFVRGAFDAAYSMSISLDEASAIISNNSRIEILKYILNSLGVPCFVAKYGAQYKLNILGDTKYYPGLFYDHDYIARMINSDYDITKCDPAMKISIDSVTELDNNYTTCYSLVTNKDTVYFGSTFLPRFYK